MRKLENKRSFTCNLTNDIYDELEKVAKEKRWSVGEVLRVVAEDYMKRKAG